MRDAIQWSYDLLDETEKKLFQRLAVFVGGRTLEAIEAVCNSGTDIPDVLDGVSSLVDKSLLKQREEESGYLSGEPRFWMLQTIREYAQERLDVPRRMEKAELKLLNVCMPIITAVSPVCRTKRKPSYFLLR